MNPWQDLDVRSARRVVTGTDSAGRSTVILDGPSPHFRQNAQYPSTSSVTLWYTPDDLASTVDNVDGRAGQHPDAGGTRFYIVTFEPGVEIPMHATPTVDYHCIVVGEVTCLLEEHEVTVRAGDVLVQRATQHGWLNRGDVTCLSVAVMAAETKTPSA